MALTLQTTKQVFDSILSNLETKIGQTSPLADKSFLRVLAGVVSLAFTSLYKLTVERTQQNLAETATGDDLDLIGSNYGVNRRSAVSAVVEITITGTNGTDVNPTMTFIADNTGIRYVPTETVTVAAGTATFLAQSQTSGESGNLSSGDTFTIESQVAGLSSAATYNDSPTGDVVTGVDREDDETYRRRVLTEIRTVGGGGNLADYRTWAEETSGVQAAFPYSGRPASEGTDQPGDRTIYVQGDPDVYSDGIPDSALLSDVRDTINTDPDTGLSRPPLGHTDDTLFVEAITVTTLYVEIFDLDAPTGTEAAVQSQAEDAVEAYFDSVYPWISGLDLESEVNDTVTAVSISNAIQSVFAVTGSSATKVLLSTSAGSGYITSYPVGEGELVKLGAVSWETTP